MIWSVPALQDTTIYEIDPYRNTGLDPILELNKTGDASTSDLTESRILIKFDLSSLSSVLADNNISINSVSASLKLYTVQESQLPLTYTLQAKALAVDWANGTGYFDNPTTVTRLSVTDGATWIEAAGTGSTSWSGSYVANTSGKSFIYNDIAGGGVWYTASIASQSFSYKKSDAVNIDVTNLVKSWYNGTLPNYGFLITYNHDLLTGSNVPESSIQFYSCETTTVYEPQLYFSWTGSQVYNVGSLSTVTYENTPILYVRSFKGEFIKDKKVRILLGVRDKYPRPSFAQNSFFATMKVLPSASYYQIMDAHNNQIVIPYGEETKINSNNSGSYFDFYTTMMYPERYYKFEVKTNLDGITEYFSSNDFIFKIVE